MLSAFGFSFASSSDQLRGSKVEDDDDDDGVPFFELGEVYDGYVSAFIVGWLIAIVCFFLPRYTLYLVQKHLFSRTIFHTRNTFLQRMLRNITP